MKSIKISVYLLFSLMLTAISCAPQQIDVEAEKAAVKAVLNSFFEAVKNKNMEQLELAWTDDPDLRVLMPYAGEDINSLEQLKEFFTGFLEVSSNFDYSVIEQDVRILGSGDAAWFSIVYDETWEVEGQTFTWDDARWTGVAEKRDGNWKIAHSHLSFALPGGQELAEVRRAIEEETEKHINYIRQGDPAAVASQYAENAIRLIPKWGVINKGRKEVEEFWRALLPMDVREFSLVTEEIFIRGNMACEIGKYSIESQAEGQEPLKDAGDYLVVWERQTDGSWIVWVDIAFSSTPAQ